MWLRARSVYTTENSSRPSGSTLGSSPGMEGVLEKGAMAGKHPA
jgi:hypothetical protein